jgi:hypothetical protein
MAAADTALAKDRQVFSKHGGMLRTSKAMRLGIHPRTLVHRLEGAAEPRFGGCAIPACRSRALFERRAYTGAGEQSGDGARIVDPEEMGNGARVQWISGRLGEAPAHAGTDFIIARDGRIAVVYFFSTNSRRSRVAGYEWTRRAKKGGSRNHGMRQITQSDGWNWLLP